jgi:ubiquitin C-terminal hydrolase
MICSGCPHRYECEERFHAINLPMRAEGLQASLNQFVHGEILDGDNAYKCERCGGVKRTALKRTCIKVRVIRAQSLHLLQTLPPVAVIQLKRFEHDWEADRPIKLNNYFQVDCRCSYCLFGAFSFPPHSICSSTRLMDWPIRSVCSATRCLNPLHICLAHR